MNQLPIINRNAILITYKKPFIDWVRQADLEHSDDLDGYAQDECPIYLLPEFGDDKEMWKVLKKCYDKIFFNEVSSWYIDEAVWPKDRTFKMFKEWFDVRAHTMIYDMVDEDIIKEET